MHNNQNAKQLQQSISYTFNDMRILEHALTHPSFAQSKFEMLEFLGDKAIALFVANYLYDKCADEKQYSTRLVSMTNKHALYAAAMKIDLPKHIKWKGEASHKHTIVSDAFEALVGAIFLDGGLQAVEKFMLFVKLEDSDAQYVVDPKNYVQEWAHQRNCQPMYELIESYGKPHDMNYMVTLTIATNKCNGCGKSIKDAQKNAARQFVVKYIAKR